MIISFIAITFVLTLWLATIWGKNSALDLFIKLALYVFSFWGAYLLLHLLPAVELSNGMRLL